MLQNSCVYFSCRLKHNIFAHFCLNIIKKVGVIAQFMSYTEMAQLELMNAAANVTSQEDLDALRLTLSLFFAERAQKAIDKMWDEGTFDQKKLDELRGQHLRTPYKPF